MLYNSVGSEQIEFLLQLCSAAFAGDSDGVLARSSRGHVYAARNLVSALPAIHPIWQSGPLHSFLLRTLGDSFGLVRTLFFDKPPDRTWGLAWHKDTSIAVVDNGFVSKCFTRPTIKAGVPHVIASDEILQKMLTLRIHLDEVNDKNGPLRVLPGSHVSCKSEGEGMDSQVVIHANPGDVLAMRPLLSHCSGGSLPGTTRHRRILHLEFASDNHLPDGFAWHDFVAGT